MSVERNRQTLRRYRRRALWGGAIVGALAATVGAGPHFQALAPKFLAILAGAIAVGALLGYLFFEIVIVNLIGPPHPRGSAGSASEGGLAAGDGVDGGGDGGD